MFLAAILVFFCFYCGAQTISGKVRSERGTAAAFVTVSFKDKANSVQTNKDGSFSIIAKKLPDTLVFSSPGLESYSVVVTEATLKDPDFEVVLLESRKSLSEVVVTGYGAKRSTATGSTSDASAEAVPVRGNRIYAKPAESGVVIRGFSGTLAPATSGSPKKMYMYDSTIRNDTVVYRTHLLTAGEVNDFNKWKMWEDFGETEFKVWSKHWNLFAKRRYCVQLQNRERQAIVSQPVYLINANTKDTVWRTLTDNTGKAELWAELDKDSSTSNYLIACKGMPKVNAANSFENGINSLMAPASCELSKVVQIAFVVDATGSMGDEIEFLKLELEDVIRKTFEAHKDLDLQAGSVFYRDSRDEYITRKIGFQKDLLKLLNFIKLQQAGGGGDKPEAVQAGLRSAIDSMAWDPSARSRLLFLILDAPPHDEDKAEMMVLTKLAASKGIRIVPIVCSGADKSTEYLMRTIALATNGTYAFLTDHSGVGLPHVKPTTDAFNVELFNALLSRIISQMIFASDCSQSIVKADPKNIPGNILKVNIYPNPTQGNITIDSKKKLKQVFITDFTGKILMNITANGKGDRWSTSIAGYPAGTYLVKYITEDDQWGAEKLVLMH
jgi:hypothetical protein